MLVNWMQIEMGKTFETIQINHNYLFFNYKIFTILNMCSKFGCGFQFFYYLKT
jgi:hypothetical protein